MARQLQVQPPSGDIAGLHLLQRPVVALQPRRAVWRRWSRKCTQHHGGLLDQDRQGHGTGCHPHG
eukprot:12975113-Alexandrium_andersonii.AAC.1